MNRLFSKSYSARTLKLTILAFTMICVILIGGIIQLSLSTSPLVTSLSDIYVNPPFSAEGYIIGPYNSTFYYAKNCTTGNYDYLSSNTRNTIEYALGFHTTVTLLEGTWILPSGLTMLSGDTLQGQGWNTVLQLASGANQNIIKFSGPTCSNVIIRNLAIDGNKAGQSDAAWRDNLSGIYSGMWDATQVGTVTDNLVIDHVYIHDIRSGAAIRLVMSNNILIENCKIENCGINDAVNYCDGIFIGNCTHVTITNYECSVVTDTAIALCNCNESSIVSPIIRACYAGIAIGNEYPASGTNHSILANYDTVTGGSIEGSTSYGVNIFTLTMAGTDYADHIIFQGLHLLANGIINANIYGLHVSFTGCTFGFRTPLTGKTDVVALWGSSTLGECHILDSAIGVNGSSADPVYIDGCYFGNDNTNYVGNVLIFGQGMTGPQGPPGTVNGLPFTYLITTNGSYYFMVSGTYGNVVYTSTNASQVVNYAIGNLTSGGNIYIAAGTYPINQIFKPNLNNTIISGAGEATILTINFGSPRNAYNLTDGLWIADCENVTIQNLRLDGSAFMASTPAAVGYPDGIYIVNSRHVTIQDCWITNWRCSAVVVSNLAADPGNIYDITVQRNHVINGLWNGITLDSFATTGAMYGVAFKDNYVEGSCDVGIDISVESASAIQPFGTQVIGNTVNGVMNYVNNGSSSPSGNYGIGIEGGMGALVQGNTVYGCEMGIIQAGTVSYPTNARGNSTISHNTVTMNSTYAGGASDYTGIALENDGSTADHNIIYGGWGYGQCIAIGGNNSIVESNKCILAGPNSNSWAIKENPDGTMFVPNNCVIIFNDVSSYPVGYRIVLAGGTGGHVFGNIGFVSPSDQIDAASFIISMASSTYSATNCTDGSVLVSSTNAVNVLLNTIGNCSAGGKIFVKSNVVFALDAETITIAKPLTLESEGWGTVQGAGDIGATFTFFRDLEVLHVGMSNGSELDGVRVLGFRFINSGGSRTAKAVISWVDTSYSQFQGNYVNMGGANATIFFMLGNGTFCDNNDISLNTLRGNVGGIALDIQAKSGVWCNVNYIKDNYFWNSGISVRLHNVTAFTGDTSYNLFTDNVYSHTTTAGILDGGSGNSFIGGVIMDIVTGYTYHGTTAMSYAKIIAVGGLSTGQGLYNEGIGLNIGSGIDRCFRVTPTAAGWGTAPTNLINCVDGNWTTVTGTGTNTTANGIVGNLTWDMGAVYGVQLRAKLGLWSSTGYMNAIWYWSLDGITFYATSGLVAASYTSTSEYVLFNQIEYTLARYMRLSITETGSSATCNVKFYECQAWDDLSGTVS